MGISPPVGQLGPDVVKASRFEPGAESENALSTRTTPSLATALEPGADDHCVCRLLGVAADRRAGIASLPITHPLAVAVESADGGGDLAVSWAFPPEITQRINHLTHTLRCSPPVGPLRTKGVKNGKILTTCRLSQMHSVRCMSIINQFSLLQRTGSIMDMENVPGAVFLSMTCGRCSGRGTGIPAQPRHRWGALRDR